MYNFDKLLMLKVWSGNGIEILLSQVVLQYNVVSTFDMITCVFDFIKVKWNIFPNPYFLNY